MSFERKFASKPKWVPDVHDELARWVLWSGGVAVVSQETALHVYGIGEFESARVHLTVPAALLGAIERSCFMSPICLRRMSRRAQVSG